MAYKHEENKYYPCIFKLVSCETQEKTREYVKNILSKNDIVFFEDIAGNIYNIEKVGVPLLSAHMDTVMKPNDEILASMVQPDNTRMIVTGGICGGDDKCGVYLILKLLVEKKHDINFIFSVNEEVGCLGIKAFFKNAENENKVRTNCLYCLVLDRNGHSDIICERNDYGTKKFEDALYDVSKKFGMDYAPKTGIYSDADFISDYISTANLSVGYYNAHSVNEYIDIDAMELSGIFTELILENVKEKFEPCEKTYNKYWNYCDYSGYGGYPEEDWWEKYNRKYSYKRNKNKTVDEFLREEIEEDFEFKNCGPSLEIEEVRCDCCGSNYFEEEDLIRIDMITSNDLKLCPECANDIYEQLHRKLFSSSKYL
jgi:hypothetical protein